MATNVMRHQENSSGTAYLQSKLGSVLTALLEKQFVELAADSRVLLRNVVRLVGICRKVEELPVARCLRSTTPILHHFPVA